MNDPKTFFDDEDYQDALVSLLVKDARTLKDCATFLSPDDFKPQRGMRHGNARWTIAEVVLEHWRKFHTPIGGLLQSSVLDYAEQMGFNDLKLQGLKEYCTLVKQNVVTAPTAVTEKVVRFKKARLMGAALREMMELQQAGQLTDEKWSAISRKLNIVSNNRPVLTDFLGTLPERNARRRLTEARVRRPWTLIDPLDALVRGLTYGEIGVLIAPYKRGKSLGLQWLAIAYVIQGLNVLLITLETPKAVVEDRLDSIVSHVPIKALTEYPQTLDKRFRRFRAMTAAQLHIYDGTQGGVTLGRVEELVNEERENGFIVDAVIIDYDDEITPETKNKDRRFEFAEIYREFRQMSSRLNFIGWTAAQTQRGTEALKILSADRLAEDISKVRKVALAISMGKGDWDTLEESIYLWVAAANNDSQHIGCHIVPDRSRVLVYDREATAKAAKRFAA